MKRLKQLIAPILTIVILGAAVIYLSGKFKYFLGLDSGGWIYLAVSVFPVLMFFGLFRLSNSSSSLGSLGYKLSAFAIAFILYFLISAILVDIVAVFTDIPPGVMGVISVVLAALFVIAGFINSFRIKVTRHSIPVPGLKKELKVAHLSDIHIGHFRGRKFLRRVVDLTNMQKPDLVVITGDFFDGRINLNTDVTNSLKSLKSPAFFVNGNHDVYSGLEDVLSVLNQSGVRILSNEVVDLNGIHIAGLNHMRADENTSGMHAAHGPVMKEVLPGINIIKNKPSILLHHSPDGIEYANREGIDLYFSGHTHGGQQFPVTLINQALFRFNKGLHDYNGTRIIVSEGIGTFGPPVRIATKSEVVIADLMPA